MVAVMDGLRGGTSSTMKVPLQPEASAGVQTYPGLFHSAGIT